jgi:hypothetical protein
MPQVFPVQVPSPISNPNSWDSISISGVLWGANTPYGGKITVQGASRFYKIDQKDAKGQDGSTQTYVGTHPKPFRLIFEMWTSQQWAFWNSLTSPIFYMSGVLGKVIPLDIIHPATSILGINRILVDDIGQPEINEQTKMIRQVITVREFLPAAPGNASVTPLGPTPPTGPQFAGYKPSARIQQLVQEEANLQAQVAGGPKTLP